MFTDLMFSSVNFSSDSAPSRKFLDANNDLYLELNSRCPLKLWKDRLVAVWGEETK